MVSDIVVVELREQLVLLLKRLYKRNPQSLAVNPGMTVEKRIEMIFTQPVQIRFEELGNIEGIDTMNLVFNEGFVGDRVFALMVGLTGMLAYSYNYDEDFYMYEDIDQQKLYNSARNIEVMSWKLKNNRNSKGELFLITSTRKGVLDNTSFARNYGKLIQTQDLLAKIIADKNNRAINTVIMGTLSAFLPI